MDKHILAKTVCNIFYHIRWMFDANRIPKCIIIIIILIRFSWIDHIQSIIMIRKSLALKSFKFCFDAFMKCSIIFDLIKFMLPFHWSHQCDQSLLIAHFKLMLSLISSAITSKCIQYKVHIVLLLKTKTLHMHFHDRVVLCRYALNWRRDFVIRHLLRPYSVQYFTISISAYIVYSCVGCFYRLVGYCYCCCCCCIVWFSTFFVYVPICASDR